MLKKIITVALPSKAPSAPGLFRVAANIAMQIAETNKEGIAADLSGFALFNLNFTPTFNLKILL